MLADRGVRKDPKRGNYELTGKGSANHDKEKQCQMAVYSSHAVRQEYTDSDGKCLVGYSDGQLSDNIYTDTQGKNDTYLLSSKAQAAGGD